MGGKTPLLIPNILTQKWRVILCRTSVSEAGNRHMQPSAAFSAIPQESEKFLFISEYGPASNLHTLVSPGGYFQHHAAAMGFVGPTIVRGFALGIWHASACHSANPSQRSSHIPRLHQRGVGPREEI